MQRSTITRSALAGLIVLAAGAPAEAKLSGSTTVKATKIGVSVLQGSGISLHPIAPARVTLKGIRVPITGGRLSKRRAAGKVRHAGGLRFAKGGVVVDARRFVVNTRKSVLTAVVGGRRVRLLDLDFTAAPVRTGKRVRVPAVNGSLTRTAARTLNAAFAVKAFERGLFFVAATIRARS